jgi:hypothetical protein
MHTNVRYMEEIAHAATIMVAETAAPKTGRTCARAKLLARLGWIIAASTALVVTQQQVPQVAIVFALSGPARR